MPPMEPITPEPGRYPVTIEAQVHGDPGQTQSVTWVVQIHVGDERYRGGGDTLDNAARNARETLTTALGPRTIEPHPR
jgi:hypothetical protein